MLIVPLLGNQSDRPALWAIGAGATLLGSGPLRGSLLVDGERARLIAGAARHWNLIIAAPAFMCGGEEKK